ncbi:uncharacterized protein [Pempheris klunzingeri]|uniref:uncharacterized protein n=1 Tax=Pempheris klunzingeri TaxID=3127111 RepID=UPI00397FE561
MSRLHRLKVFIHQRLAAAVDDILGHLEETISEYEEETQRSRSALLQEASRPAAAAQEAASQTSCVGSTLRASVSQLTSEDSNSGFPADVQQLVVSKEEVPPEQQQRSPSLDQEEPPEPPHIKEEEEELWSSQGGEQLGGLEEADITKITFSPVAVKSEDDDEEKPQSSQLHQSQTEENREDCGGSEPAGNFDPDHHLQPVSFVTTSNVSGPETADRNSYWMEIREPQPDLNPLNSNIVPVNDVGCNTGAKSFSCSECGKGFSQKGTLQRHVRRHTGEKPFTCSVCNGQFSQKVTLDQHMRVHTGEKPFSCSVCGKRFTQKGNLKYHMTVHTREKPFSCSVCEKRFTRQSRVKNHKCVVESTSGL